MSEIFLSGVTNMIVGCRTEMDGYTDIEITGQNIAYMYGCFYIIYWAHLHAFVSCFSYGKEIECNPTNEQVYDEDAI